MDKHETRGSGGFASMTAAERRRLAELAIGRLLALGSRPTQPGDVEQYEECRRAILAAEQD